MGTRCEGQNGFQDRDPRRLRYILHALSRRRFTAGTAFQRLHADELSRYRRHDRRYLRSGSVLPGLPSISSLQVENQAIYTIDKSLRAPYMGQLAIGVDRQLPGRTQLSINYVNTRGVHVLRERDINAPDPYAPFNGARPFASNPAIPGFNEDIYQYETSGIFKQTQLTVNANTRLNSHFQLQGYYVFGEAHTNANGFPMNQYNDNLDWGRASFDIRHRGYFGGAVGLPYKLNLNPFVTMQSGAPFNITTGQAFDGDGITNTRPFFAPCSSAKYVTRFGCFSPNRLPTDPYRLAATARRKPP